MSHQKEKQTKKNFSIQSSGRDMGAPPKLKKEMLKNSNDMLFVLGGLKCNGNVETFTESKQCWLRQDNIRNGPSEETLAVSVGQEIIVMEATKRRTRSFNVVTKDWKDLSPVPMPVYREGMTATADGNLVYLIGGEEHWTRCDVYDVQLHSWSSAPELNVWRYYSSAAVLEGKIYCCGGWDGKQYSKQNEVYDPKKKRSWTLTSDMTAARSRHSVVSCTGFLWAVGGWDGWDCVHVLERYDPKTDVWTKMASMPTGRLNLSASLYFGSLYAIGGIAMDGERFATVDVYDPEKDRWESGSPLNDCRNYHASCVVQEKPDGV